MLKITITLILGFQAMSFAEDVQKYKMNLVWVVDSKVDKNQFIITLNDRMAFSTKEGFLKYIKSMPSGSEIEWDPGCLRIGNEPFLNSENDMKLLINTADQQKIKLTIVPGG